MSTRFVLLLSLACAASACVGSREALQITDLMVESAKQATATVEAMEKAETAKVAAHLATRKALRDASHAYQETSRRDAQSQIRVAHLDSTSRLEKDHVDALVQLVKKRAEAARQVTEVVSREMTELEKVEAEAESAALAAKDASEKAPADRVLYQTLLEKQREYLAIAAFNRDVELRSLEAAGRRLDAEFEKALARLDQAVAKHRAALDAKRDDFLNKLPPAPAPMDLGPDPTSSATALAGIKAFAKATQDGALALRNYISANGLGRGSFFADFIRSFGGGLLGGLSDKVQEKVDWNSIKGSAEDVVKQLSAEAKASLAETLSSAGKELLGIAGESDKPMLDAAKETAGAITEEARGKVPANKESK